MDKITIYYCSKCHEKKKTISYEKAKEILEEGEDFLVEDRCISTCGLAKKKFCAEIDDEVITADTLKKLIENMGEL